MARSKSLAACRLTEVCPALWHRGCWCSHNPADTTRLLPAPPGVLSAGPAARYCFGGFRLFAATADRVKPQLGRLVVEPIRVWRWREACRVGIVPSHVLPCHQPRLRPATYGPRLPIIVRVSRAWFLAARRDVVDDADLLEFSQPWGFSVTQFHEVVIVCMNWHAARRPCRGALATAWRHCRPVSLSQLSSPSDRFRRSDLHSVRVQVHSPVIPDRVSAMKKPPGAGS